MVKLGSQVSLPRMRGHRREGLRDGGQVRGVECLQVEYPVLGHAVLLVLGKLGAYVAVGGSAREDFHDQVGRAFSFV